MNKWAMNIKVVVLFQVRTPYLFDFLLDRIETIILYGYTDYIKILILYIDLHFIEGCKSAGGSICRNDICTWFCAWRSTSW